jgi:hypothetical protein
MKLKTSAVGTTDIIWVVPMALVFNGLLFSPGLKPGATKCVEPMALYPNKIK